MTKIFLIVSILFSLLWAFSEITNEKKELSLIENEIKKQTLNVKFVEKLLSELAIIENNKKYLLNIKQNNISKVWIIAELSRIIPKDGWIIIFYYQEKENNGMAIGQVIIKGFAKTASKILPEIEKSSIFEKAEFIEPIIKKPEGELFNIRFDVINSKKSSIKTSIEKGTKD